MTAKQNEQMLHRQLDSLKNWKKKKNQMFKLLKEWERTRWRWCEKKAHIYWKLNNILKIVEKKITPWAAMRRTWCHTHECFSTAIHVECVRMCVVMFLSLFEILLNKIQRFSSDRNLSLFQFLSKICLLNKYTF